MEPSPNQVPGRSFIPFAVLGVALLITVCATIFVVSAATAHDRARFENDIDRAQDAIHGRIETYINLLRGAVGLCSTQTYTTRAQFHSYVQPIELRQRYPGIQGIGIAVRLTKAMKPAAIERLAKDGYPTFKIHPEQGQDEYLVIIYLEPLDDRNKVAIGYDMSTEPTRRAAMDLARDTAAPAASGKVTLVQEIDEHKQAGFLIYVPGYYGGTPPTLEGRRKLLGGFIYAPFRADDLLNDIISSERLGSEINFSIYDGESVKPEALLHHSNAADASKPARFTKTMPFDVAGRRWTVVYRTAPGFENSSKMLMYAVPIAGTVVGLLLFALTAAQATAQRNAERIAADLRASEQHLRRARDDAEAANRLKDEFLATVSHELRTPLNAMLGWSQLLRSGQASSEDMENGLETIERNAKAQAQLVEDLLDVSRIVSGQLRMDFQSVDLAEVIESAIAGVRPAAEVKKIQVVRAIEGANIRVRGDPGRLQQIVWNLLSNAVKFTPTGGRVDLRLVRESGDAEITVTDTGRGIPPHFLPHVFDQFRQADASITRKHGGLGIGLGIVKSLVELHGGTVFAGSDGDGKGATFTVTLPLEAATPQRFAPVAEPQVAISLHGVRVLAIDDEADSLELTAQLLRRYGAEVSIATSAAAAMEIIRDRAPDVLVSDISMPSEDGYSLLRRIRAMSGEAAHIPAIALTAFARAEDRDRAFAAGYQVHKPKPLDGADLAAAVAKLVAGLQIPSTKK